MIAYHGTRVAMDNASAARVLARRHALVSFEDPSQLSIVQEVCASYCADNGSFSKWRRGEPVGPGEWTEFYRWVEGLVGPLDFVIVPDAIDGDEATNDVLLDEWPFGKFLGAPVWHLHESLDRLDRLVSEWPRVCLGSSGVFATPGSEGWWRRMEAAMGVACDASGRPRARLHGLRMLSPDLFTRIPLYSADSTNAGRNAGNEDRWRGAYAPPDVAWRGIILAERIEAFQSPPRWTPSPQLSMEIG